jgi:predicted Zn-dependent peptidase
VKPIACALLALAMAVSLAEAQKQSPPPPRPPVPFSLPDVTRDALANGMAIRLVPYGDVPKVSVRLVIQTGNIDEEPSQVWLADLMGDLMQQGTTALTAREVAAKVARMGGALDVGVGVNQITIGGDVLADFGADMIAVIGAVARHPAFPASELPRLKKDMLRRLSIARSEPQQLAIEKFHEVLYPDHPYGRLFPSADAVEGYSREDVTRFYSRNVGADRAALYVVGRFEEESVRGAIRQAFESWERGRPPTAPVVMPQTERAIHLVDRPGAVQSTIYMGNPVMAPTDPDYLPLLVTNALLGGYFSSRVTSNLREEKGYAYSPFSTISSRLGTSYFAQVADVSTAVTGPSLKEILFEIDRLQEMPPSTKELTAVQNYLSGTFVLQNSSRAGIINQLAFLDLHGLGEDYLRRFVQRMNALTPAHIQQMAQRYLRDERMTIVIVGDRAAIAKQVEPYGRVTPASPERESNLAAPEPLVQSKE